MDISTVKASVDALAEKTTAAVSRAETGIATVQAEVDRLASILKRPGFAANDNATGGDAAGLKAEHKAISAFIRSGDESGLREVRAAMSVGSDPDGGYLVLPNQSSTMTKKLYDEVTIRRLARVIPIESGSEWVEPIDTEEAGATWVGENESRPETTSPKLKELRISLDEIYALQKVSQRLLDDSQYDVGGWVDEKITEKFARSENAAFLTGNGVGKPRGFLTYDTATTADASRAWGTLQHVVSGGATHITADALRDMYWTLRAPYRRNAVWLMSSATANDVDKLKDGNGDYLWRNGMTLGAQPTLLGLPVEFDEGMPAVAAGAFPIALADWRAAYTIVDRPGIRLLRDPYTSKPHVLFYAYRRVGGALANSEALKLMQVAASA